MDALAVQLAELTTVHLGLFDAGGVLRSKRLPAAQAARAAREGWTFIDALQYWDHADSTVENGRPWREAPAEVDLASLRPFPFEPGAGLLLAEFTGGLGELSARQQLRRQLVRLDAAGLTAQAGFEVEFIALDADIATLRAGSFWTLPPVAASNRCWSTLTPAVEADVLRELEATLVGGGIRLHHLCSELGPGCWELALGTTDVLRAADDAALAKIFVRAAFARRGRTATFMAQLSESHPGLGGHPVLSLRGASPGGLFDRPGILSEFGRRVVGGVTSALPELMLLYAPTVNAYRRVAPGNWAPRTASWGIGNYTCALRVVDHPVDARLELRLPGADVAPHAAFAALLGSALHGLERGVEPPPPCDDDARLRVDLPPLPRSLAEAADRFAASGLARTLFGDAFVEHAASRARAEEAALRRLVPTQERARYLDQV